MGGGRVTNTFTENQSSEGMEPGWHPDRLSPNVQKYWDGNGWIAQRRWINRQWVNEPPPGAPAPLAGVAGSVGPVPGFGSSPYAPAGPARTHSTTRQSTSSISLGSLGALLCSILLVVGSLAPWLTFSLVSLHFSVSGTDSGISLLVGINGWITFAGGVLLFILFCMMAVSDEPLFRTVTLLVAVVTAGFAFYDLVRIVQKISQVPSGVTGPVPVVRTVGLNAGVGWGLIVVAIGALGALVCAIGAARNG